MAISSSVFFFFIRSLKLEEAKRNHVSTYFISDGDERPGVQVPRGPARKETESEESTAPWSPSCRARFRVPSSAFNHCFPPCLVVTGSDQPPPSAHKRFHRANTTHKAFAERSQREPRGVSEVRRASNQQATKPSPLGRRAQGTPTDQMRCFCGRAAQLSCFDRQVLQQDSHVARNTRLGNNR